MPDDAQLRKHSSWFKGEKRFQFSYNPFRKLSWKLGSLHLEADEPTSDNKDVLPPLPSPKTQEETPYIVGNLFSLSALRLNPAHESDSFAIGPLPAKPSVGKAFGLVDEERISVASADARPRSVAQWLHVLWKRSYGLPINSTSTQDEGISEVESDREPSEDIRKRRVIVVEYGNTDDIQNGALFDPSRYRPSLNLCKLRRIPYARAGMIQYTPRLLYRDMLQME